MPIAQIRVRKAEVSDAPRACEILIRSVNEICGPDYGNDRGILDEWCSNKTPEIVRGWIENPDNYFIVAELPAHGIVGVGMYKQSESSIYLCYLVPEALKLGIGKHMLSMMEDEARRLGCREIFLGSSVTARGFYERHGYESNGEPIYWGKVLGFPMRKILDV